jgi:hypothetical protein
MNPFDLTVHDIQVQDTTNFGRNGQVAQGKRVTFWVGDHGPFVLAYATKDEGNTSRIKGDIDAQVQQLRELSGTP